MPTQETLHPYKKRHSSLVGVALIYIENDLYSSKIKIIRCQLALMNSSSIVGFVS